MKNIAKILLMPLLALGLMGNEGCEEEVVVPEGRVLKKNAELSRLSSAQMVLPDGKPFDFEYLVNAQIYDVISRHNKFVVPFVAGASTTSFEAASVGVADADFDRLSDWQNETRNRVMAANVQGTPECLKRGPQVELGGAVESFEIAGGGGLFFGFGPNVGPITSIGGSIDVQFAQLSTSMVGYHPLSRVITGSGRARTTQTRVDIDLSINFGLFRLGPRFFFQSPLANVSRRALDITLRNLSDDMDQKAEQDGRPAWETKVRNDMDTHVIIYAGRRHGLKVGDELAVYNMNHFWENDGTPCEVRYEGALRKSNVPAALLRIENDAELGDDITRARVFQQGQDAREPGAQVVMWKMVEESDEEQNNQGLQQN